RPGVVGERLRRAVRPRGRGEQEREGDRGAPGITPRPRRRLQCAGGRGSRHGGDGSGIRRDAGGGTPHRGRIDAGLMQENGMNKLRASVLMRHEVGLHARPSVKLTKLAKAFQSRIDLGLSPDGPWSDAKSIVKVMATKAPKDSTIYFRAEGGDAKAALDALVTLVDEDFPDGP